MGPILKRYILRETAQTWAMVTGILLLILLTDQFARVLDDAAGAELPRDAIFAVMGLSSINYLTILIPIGAFLGIILALARMYRDSEMAALMACGVGNTSLYRPILLFGLMLAAVVAWLAMEAGPSAQRQVEKIFDEARKTADLAMLAPGRFNSFGRENVTIYAEEVSDDGKLRNVFVQLRSQDRVIVVVAREADQRNDEQAGTKVLIFRDGQRFEGVPGSQEFLIMSFAEHGIPFEVRAASPGDIEPEAQSVWELFDRMDREAIAELQWRASSPISLLVMMLLAVPLSRTRPRQGRYSGLLNAILIYVIYSNLLAASKVWIERGEIPAWAGLWWVHLLFIAGGLALLQYQNRFFASRRARMEASAAGGAA